MNELRADVAIIGAGTAGMRAYREAVKVTQNVLLIESGPYGTTCARVGCMPSKLLIAAAEAATWGERAAPFGVRYEAPRVDGRAVMRRVRDERDRFAGLVVRTVEGWPKEHRVRARARFVSDGELELDDGRRVVADRIVIATGSRPNVPQAFEALGDRLIDNEELFDFEDLPASVAVFGAGVVGLELGQALHRLGTRMALFGRGNAIGPLTDPEVVSAARGLFAAEFEFHPDAEVTRQERAGEGVEVDQALDGRTLTHRFDYALVATGRRPNVDGLGLENTSLVLDDRGMPAYDHHTGRCGESRIFIAGDANNRLPLLHEAADEGMIAGYNAAHFPEIRRFAGSAPLTVIFTDPQIMMVGETHRALVERDAPFATGSVDWSDQGRARVMGVNHGLLRVYGDIDTGKFLGAEMVGPAAEHIAHLLAWARQSELTVGAMLERPFYHPVLEEGVRTALRDLNYNMRMGPKPPPRCLDCGPGG
jgi:dihydrolipoamide dehydrogenase